MKIAVVGGGTGGCTFAGTVAHLTKHDVVLLEAGPDYGPFDRFGWPSELLDSRRIPVTHDWGLVNEDPHRRFELLRAKVLGGCSSHNGCSSVRGLRGDFDGWAVTAGNDFWSTDGILQDFDAVEKALRVRRYDAAEITPFQQDVYAAAVAAGYPISQDINNLDEGVAASICPVNKRGGVRWNAAFAFIDPVRGKRNFAIIDHFEARELLWNANRVTGVRGARHGQQRDVAADVVVLAAGAYGSPILLMRSGVGDADLLASARIKIHHPLSGVGRNLQDHPALVLDYEASPALIARMVEFEMSRLAYDEGIIVKDRSPVADGPIDLHIFSCGGRRFEPAGWYWQIWVGLLAARSRGQIRPVWHDGFLNFAIEHRQLSDQGGEDMKALEWGVARARAIAAAEPLAAMLKAETAPGSDIRGPALTKWALENHVGYFHPAGSCAIGKDPGAGAVVDGLCRVHGVKGLMIADASVMPKVTAANTNIPTAALAHRLGRHIDEIIATM